MASATHLFPTSPLSVMVPNPRRGICRPLLSVRSGIKFSWVPAFGAANDCALPRLRNMAEAANSALVCKNWRRLNPLELRSLFILVVLWRLAEEKQFGISHLIACFLTLLLFQSFTSLFATPLSARVASRKRIPGE